MMIYLSHPIGDAEKQATRVITNFFDDPDLRDALSACVFAGNFADQVLVFLVSLLTYACFFLSQIVCHCQLPHDISKARF